MIVSTHHDYLTHLRQRLVLRLDDPAVRAGLETDAYEFVTLTVWSLDPQREALQALYLPHRPGREIALLGSWRSFGTVWVGNIRNVCRCAV